MRVNREIIKHMANKSIKKSGKRCFWAAIMVSQSGIWSVIWLKCTENGRWPPVIISDSGERETYYQVRVVRERRSPGVE